MDENDQDISFELKSPGLGLFEASWVDFEIILGDQGLEATGVVAV